VFCAYDGMMCCVDSYMVITCSYVSALTPNSIVLNMYYVIDIYTHAAFNQIMEEVIDIVCNKNNAMK
jgi:hypothetical protein